MVRPARPAPRRTLPCSIVDLVMTRFYVLTVHLYRPPPDGSLPESHFFDAAKLKAALADVLVPFYPAAGRVRLDGNGRPEIDCNAEGVVFVEAESNAVLDEFGTEHRPKYMKLVPATAAVGGGHDTSTSPLVTRFRCGGASLGVALDHLLADGFAAFNFINSWAEAARGNTLAAPPLLDRGVLAARNPPTPCFSCEPPPPCLELAQPFVTCSFRLTRGDIDRLKSKCVAGQIAGTRCGTYEAIVAHTWRCACIARRLPPDQKTRVVYMPVNIRHRLKPPLPASYLGNAILRATCDAAVRDMTGVPTGEIAGKVRRELARMDDAYVMSVIDYLQLQASLQPDLTKLSGGAHLFGSPNLIVNSWVQLPLYDADFGGGRPVFVEPVKLLCEGMAQIFPRPATADGLTLVIASASLPAVVDVLIRGLFMVCLITDGCPLSLSSILAVRHLQLQADAGRHRSSQVQVVSGQVAGTRYGTYEAIVTHTWRYVRLHCTRAPAGPEDSTVHAFTSASCAASSRPSWRPTWELNVILRAACVSTVGDVTGGPTQEIVGKVQQVLARMDDTFVRSAMECLLLQPDLPKVRAGSQLYRSPNMQVNSWVQLPLYDADFRWWWPVFSHVPRHAGGRVSAAFVGVIRDILNAWRIAHIQLTPNSWCTI
ncbi:hypothetical protein Taro_016457 [Colocasia esculenta]|uniref:Uncharacterized protein n=1 Tax=Colocasia esculenta TaxID=4460 RepID=A0A843UDV6_COLES|nr:hypothetical protein [Colocasia esculenta]